MAQKSENTYYLVLCRKSLPTIAFEKQTGEEGVGKAEEKKGHFNWL